MNTRAFVAIAVLVVCVAAPSQAADSGTVGAGGGPPGNEPAAPGRLLPGFSPGIGGTGGSHYFTSSCEREPHPLPQSSMPIPRSEQRESAHFFGSPLVSKEFDSAPVGPFDRFDFRDAHTPRETPRLEETMRGEVRHAFSLQEVRELMKERSCEVVIAHGVRSPSRSEGGEFWHDEMAPVYVSDSNPTNNVSLAQLRSLLAGQIREWKDVCPEAHGSVKVYLHGGKLQRKAARTLFSSLDVDPYKPGVVTPEFADTYEALEGIASQDPGGLVIGLRAIGPGARLKELSIDGQKIGDPQASERYPLRVPLSIYAKNTRAAVALKAAFIKEVEETNRSLGLR